MTDNAEWDAMGHCDEFREKHGLSDGESSTFGKIIMELLCQISIKKISFKELIQEFAIQNHGITTF